VGGRTSARLLSLDLPFIWALTTTANLFLRLMHLRPASGAEMLHSPDELRLVLQHVDLDPGARRLIDACSTTLIGWLAT